MTILFERPLLEPLFELSAYADAPAVLLEDRVLSYADLDGLVAERARQLGTTRRLVMIEGANALEPLVTYLAALAGRHVVLLVPGLGEEAPRRQWDRLAVNYDPDVVCTLAGGLREVRPGTRHELHPDLAVLLGTSGSTGSPKLVRLSRENLRANAEAIALYLDLSEHDIAATTLPLHYCYGLSVVNSHLARGAALWLTERSVMEEEFWTGFAAAGATSFAGVPYTFDLLDQAGFASRDLPSLRYVTQAGGALAPDRVRALASLGFDFFVMYGQTEATARMAYLPPSMATSRPGTIGVPVLGGSFRIDGGELVYSGANVMLGYATSPSDLALGRVVHELRTGDLAIQHDDGLYEITGRCNRIAKLFGTRLDLDHAERLLVEAGIPVRVLAHDGRLVVFTTAARAQQRITDHVIAEHCLPAHAVQVIGVEAFPVTASGKPDYRTLDRRVVPPEVRDESIRDLFAQVLRRPDATEEDSFVSLRGDSLSFVEVSLRLERKLGALPVGWQELPVRTLSSLAPRRRGWLTGLEMPVFLRALAIVLIIGSHVELWDVTGGAHLLLGVVGFNLARFQLGSFGRRERLSRLAGSLRELLIPAVLWVGGVALVSGKYDVVTVLMLNNWLGTGNHFTQQWQLWFIEAVVWTSVAWIALFSLPRVNALERSHPFAFALAVLGVATILRVLLVGVEAGSLERYSAPAVAWFIVLGWVIARATTLPQRLLVSMVMAVSVHGFFDDAQREGVIMAGFLLLLWLPQIRLPRPLAWLVGIIGSATLFIYLTHWVIYPPLEDHHNRIALVACLVGGIALWKFYAIGRGSLSRCLLRDTQHARSRRSRRSPGNPGPAPSSALRAHALDAARDGSG